MTITESEIYWITRLDAFHELIAPVVILSFILDLALFFNGIYLASENDRMRRKFFLCCHAILLIDIILVVGKIFLPTTKEMVVIKAVPFIANSKIVSKDSETYIRRLLEATLEKIEKTGEK